MCSRHPQRTSSIGIVAVQVSALRSRPKAARCSSCFIGLVERDRSARRARVQPRLDLGNGPSQMQTKTASPKNAITGLWISRLGCPLKYGSVARAITETVRMTLGVPVTPHLFRSAGATSAALHASKSPHLASALLQHTDPKTTEAHYIRASSLSVARDFAALIGDLRTP